MWLMRSVALGCMMVCMFTAQLRANPAGEFRHLLTYAHGLFPPGSPYDTLYSSSRYLVFYGSAGQDITVFSNAHGFIPTLLFSGPWDRGYDFRDLCIDGDLLYMYGERLEDGDLDSVLRRYNLASNEPWEFELNEFNSDPRVSPRFVAMGNILVFYHNEYGPDKITILDFGNFQNPVLRSELTLQRTNESPESVHLSRSGSLVFVSSGSGGLQIVDVSDPDSPRQTADLPLMRARDAILRGSYLYVLDQWSGTLTNPNIYTYDLQDASQPRLLDSRYFQYYAERLFLDGERLYKSGHILSLRNPAQPASFGVLSAPPYAEPYGGYVNGYIYNKAFGYTFDVYRYIPDTPLANLSDQTFLVDTLRAEGQVYSDRIQQWREPIPERLRDQPMIMMRDDVRLTTGVETLFQFEIEEPGMVYVGVDERMTDLPTWLESWEPSGLRLATETGTGRRLYQRAYPAGPVKLGCNRDPGDTNPPEYEMYSVFFVSTRASSDAWAIYE